jgi:uncharacterized membrane protein
MMKTERSTPTEARQSVDQEGRSSPLRRHRDRRPSFRLLWVFAMIAVAAGICFRLTNLERKVYWGDEVWTSVWLSGHARAEMLREVFDGREVGPRDVWEYLRVRPDRGVRRTLLAVAADDPLHPPLYLALLRAWAGVFGDSIGAIRGFSAVIGILALPGIYLLCLELFRSRRVAGMAAALMAVSPFHLLYAQEARPYSLWTLAALLSSAALLRALRLRTRKDWGIYAATVALGAYTHHLFGLVIAGHGVYVLCGGPRPARHRKARLAKSAVDYLLATLVGLVSFLPWVVIVLLNRSQEPVSKVWVLKSTDPPTVLRHVICGIEWVFLDISGAVSHRVGGYASHWSTYVIALFTLALAGYAIHFLSRRAPRRAILFVWTLAGAPVVLLVLPDLLLGGRLLSTPRFLVPLFLGVQLAVAYFLAHGVSSTRPLERGLWRAVVTVLLLGGFASCLAILREETWWNKYVGGQNILMAKSINHAANPLVISDAPGTNFTKVISLSRLLKPAARLMLVVPPKVPAIPPHFSEVFVFKPSPDLRESIEEQVRSSLEPVGDDGLLWRILRKPQS